MLKKAIDTTFMDVCALLTFNSLLLVSLVEEIFVLEVFILCQLLLVWFFALVHETSSSIIPDRFCCGNAFPQTEVGGICSSPYLCVHRVKCLFVSGP